MLFNYVKLSVFKYNCESLTQMKIFHFISIYSIKYLSIIQCYLNFSIYFE